MAALTTAERSRRYMAKKREAEESLHLEASRKARRSALARERGRRPRRVSQLSAAASVGCEACGPRACSSATAEALCGAPEPRDDEEDDDEEEDLVPLRAAAAASARRAPAADERSLLLEPGASVPPRDPVLDFLRGIVCCGAYCVVPDDEGDGDDDG